VVVRPFQLDIDEGGNIRKGKGGGGVTGFGGGGVAELVESVLVEEAM
jgi:hypothetical protein